MTEYIHFLSELQTDIISFTDNIVVQILIENTNQLINHTYIQCKFFIKFKCFGTTILLTDTYFI